MVEPPIFISSFFLEYVLPFVLVFTLIFAILQKSQLLGENKKQINAIIALVTGLILIASPFSYIVVKLMPFLAIVAVILLVFMLLYGFVQGKVEGDVLQKTWLKALFGVILGIALITAILMITGFWDVLFNLAFNRQGGSSILINGFMLLIIAGVIVAVVLGTGKKE
jgi:hypothetical protein